MHRLRIILNTIPCPQKLEITIVWFYDLLIYLYDCLTLYLTYFLGGIGSRYFTYSQ